MLMGKHCSGCTVFLLRNSMATEAQKAKSAKKPAYRTRVVRRCVLCGRHAGYMRDFGLCRICFREHAELGNIPGVRKSSW